MYNFHNFAILANFTDVKLIKILGIETMFSVAIYSEMT